MSKRSVSIDDVEHGETIDHSFHCIYVFFPNNVVKDPNTIKQQSPTCKIPPEKTMRTFLRYTPPEGFFNDNKWPPSSQGFGTVL